MRKRGVNVLKQIPFKYILLLFICLCFFSYVVLDFNFNTKLSELKENLIFENKPSLSDEMSKAYFVDTFGCKMPSLNVLDSNIAQYIFKVPKIKCNRPLTVSSKHQVIVNISNSDLFDLYNISDINQIKCDYKELRRYNDSRNELSKDVNMINIQNNTDIYNEFIKITCKNAENESFYKDFHFFTPDKSTQKSHTTETSEDKVSVFVLGIDSVSRLNYHRQMDLTSKLILNHFDATEFLGYNKVGDNTYPNLIPVLTGLDENELSLACLANGTNSSYDNCPFIWKRYKENLFQTVYAEDVAYLGLFNFFRKGFNEPPTDYYLRPVLLEMENTIARNKKENVYLCLGSRKPSDVLIEYIHKLVPLFQKGNFFSFFWLAALTHDFFNTPQLIDKDIHDLVLLLNKTNVLNNTIMFLMSDHGLRWGPFRKTYQGMMEERQPLLIALLPQWFSEKYPAATSNLRENTRKLTTHFDLHATLRDLTNLQSINTLEIQQRSLELLETESMPRGISLFLSIPATRTCEHAAIASHWCTCYEKQKIATNDARVQRVARFAVRHINKKLSSYSQCRVLYLNSIFEASIGSPNLNIVKEAEGNVMTDITVRLQTKPGLAEFEATVRLSDDEIKLTGTISRINLYGRQSYCIDDYDLKMFCYCDR